MGGSFSACCRRNRIRLLSAVGSSRTASCRIFLLIFRILSFSLVNDKLFTERRIAGIFNLNGIHPGFIGIDCFLFIGTRAVEDEVAAEVEVIIDIGKLLLLSARFLQSHLHIIDFDFISEALSILAVNPELYSLSCLRCHGLLRDVHLESRVAL